MSEKIKIWSWRAFLAGMFCFGVLSVLVPPQNLIPATLTKGYTFATNETVTAAKLHSLVDSATIANITASDIDADAVGSSEIAAGAVTDSELAANSVITAKILDRNVTSSKLATNAVTGIELSTNIDFRSGAYFFTNANTSLNFTNAVFGFTTNQIPFSAVSNVVSAVSGMSKVRFSTNLTGNVSLPNGSWTGLFSYTTTLGSNSYIRVHMKGGIDGSSALNAFILTDGNTNYVAADQDANTFVQHYHSQIITTNLVIRGGFRVDAGSVTLQQHPATGIPTLTDATAFVVEEER